MAEPAISASASTSTSESQSDLQPSRGSEDEILKKPANDRKNAKKKKDVFVDPEVVRRRREEKALARQKAAEAEEQAKANGDVPPKKLRFRKRCMVDIPCQSSGFGQASVPAISNAVDAVSLKITIMTWNVSAKQYSFGLGGAIELLESASLIVRMLTCRQCTLFGLFSCWRKLLSEEPFFQEVIYSNGKIVEILCES